MDSTIKTVISLIKSALYKEKTVIPEDFNWESAKKIILSQSISELVYYGLINSGIQVPEWLSYKFYERVYFSTSLWQKADDVIAEFDKAGIEYIPLKGVSVKNRYPEPYMRHMNDVDILIREKDYKKTIKPIMKNLGFTAGAESDHEYIWHKDGQTIELHKRIIPSYNKDFYEVIGDGWEWLKKNGEYVYLFVHLAKHYRDSGIGVVHLIDLEVCKNTGDLFALTALHLDKFYDNVKNTLDCWFRDKEFDPVTTFLTEKFFSGGEYGTTQTQSRSMALKSINQADGSIKKARVKNAFRALFPPYSAMKMRYKILKTLPFLLPVFYIWRLIRAPFSGRVKKRIDMNKSIKKDDYRDELKFVGLDFWFK